MFQHILKDLIQEMADSSLEIEVPHPEDRVISNMLLANSMNSLSKVKNILYTKCHFLNLFFLNFLFFLKFLKSNPIIYCKKHVLVNENLNYLLNFKMEPKCEKDIK